MRTIHKARAVNTRSYIVLVHNAAMKKTTIFDRVVKAYKNAGLKSTQTAIAEDLGIAQPSVGKWNAGGQIKPAHILKIAKRTKVCVEWLYTETGPQYPTEPDVLALIKQLEQLAPDDRAKLLKFATVLSED